MRYATTIVLSAGLFLLAACAPATDIPATDHSMHQMGTDVSSAAPQLLLHDIGAGDDRIAFLVLQPDAKTPFEDYGISHTKEMHLIVVRKDLRHFQHLHPERDADGAWSVDFQAPAGGDYWYFADFVDSKSANHVLRMDHKSFPGDPGERGVLPNARTTKEVDGYTITFDPISSADGTTFLYTIKDRQGRFILPEEYLGAKGHSVILSSSGEYHHTHPYTDYVGYSPDDQPQFFVPAIQRGFYRVFTQFKLNGTVVTVDFDWDTQLPPLDENASSASQ